MSHNAVAAKEAHIQRNPHPDFKKVESSRPPFDSSRTFHYTQTPKPDWKLGGAGNDNGASLQKKHVEIDPYEPGREARNNYKLLISGIVPRPIGFTSTRSADGNSTNLAPFSYFNVFAHDPPTFCLGFACSLEKPNDTLRNILDTKELTVNIISEHYLEAANSASINAPYGTSEWSLSGLTPAPSSVVKPSFVKEAVFAIEARLASTTEIKSPATGNVTATLVVVNGVRFHAREDAINEEASQLDAAVLAPVSRLGGITYARVVDAIEIPRPNFEHQVEEDNAHNLVQPKQKGQL